MCIIIAEFPQHMHTKKVSCGVVFSWIFREPETLSLESCWAVEFPLMGISTHELVWMKYKYFQCDLISKNTQLSQIESLKVRNFSCSPYSYEAEYL